MIKRYHIIAEGRVQGVGMTSQYSDASAYKYLLKSIVSAREWWVFGILLAVVFCLWIIRRKPGSGTRTQTILLLCISLLLCTVPPYFLFDSYLRSLHLVSSDDPDYFELDSYIYDMAPWIGSQPFWIIARLCSVSIIFFV